MPTYPAIAAKAKEKLQSKGMLMQFEKCSPKIGQV